MNRAARRAQARLDRQTDTAETRSRIDRIRRSAASAEATRVDVSAHLVIRADTANDEDRSIEVVVATEDPILGIDREWNYVDQVLIIRKENLPTSVPMQDSHATRSIKETLGSVRDFRIEEAKDGPLLVARMFFAETQDGKDAYSLYRDKHLTDVSISAMATGAVTRIEPGKSKSIKGKMFTAGERPMDVFTRWEAREVSAVIRGADQRAKVRRSAQQEIIMNKFLEWCKRKGLDHAAADEVQRGEWFEQYMVEAEKAQRAELEAKLREDAAKQTAQRADGGEAAGLSPEQVEGIVTRAIKQRDELESARRSEIVTICGDDLPELARQATLEGWDVKRTSAEAIKAVRAAQNAPVGAPAIHTGAAAVNRADLANAILMRGAVLTGDDIVRQGGEQGAQLAERADKIRSMSMVDICRTAIQLDGRQVPMNRDELMRAAFTTTSLPQIFSNVANKSVMKGYLAAMATWRRWCSIGSASNFKANTKIRATDLGDLEQVTPTGKVVDGHLGEEYEQYSLARYAKKQIISEMNIINDDLDILTRIPQMMGNRAGSLISKLVYTHLLANGNMTDGVALFHANHNNLVTSATYKLSAGAAALRKALETLRKQTDSDGEAIDVEPRVLLCAPEDEEYARALLASIKLGEGSTAGSPTANIFGSMGIEPVVESRLSNSNYTGYSTVAWYLMGDKNMVDTVEVAFLDGKQEPTVQFFNQQEIGIDTIGVGYRVIMDAVAKALDHRGMVKIAGA